jgi:broad specificity phosphatase PhoE
MTIIYLVQHGEKHQAPGDPGLTERGRMHAARTGQWMRHAELGAIYSSPLRRAMETAHFIATAANLPFQPDVGLRERMNWDGTQPIEAFLAEWAQTERDRTSLPAAAVPPARQASGYARSCSMRLLHPPRWSQ